MKETRTKRDPNHIVQYEHDELSGAKKVKMVDTEMSIELDADDGDSVQTQARRFEYSPKSEEEVDVSQWSEYQVYSKGATFEVYVSPGDDNWYLDVMIADRMPIARIMAKKMKVKSDQPIIILGRG